MTDFLTQLSERTLGLAPPLLRPRLSGVPLPFGAEATPSWQQAEPPDFARQADPVLQNEAQPSAAVEESRAGLAPTASETPTLPAVETVPPFQGVPSVSPSRRGETPGREYTVSTVSVDRAPSLGRRRSVEADRRGPDRSLPQKAEPALGPPRQSSGPVHAPTRNQASQRRLTHGEPTLVKTASESAPKGRQRAWATQRDESVRSLGSPGDNSRPERERSGEELRRGPAAPPLAPLADLPHRRTEGMNPSMRRMQAEVEGTDPPARESVSPLLALSPTSLLDLPQRRTEGVSPRIERMPPAVEAPVDPTGLSTQRTWLVPRSAPGELEPALRLPARPGSLASEPVVRVTIGSIQVRALTPQVVTTRASRPGWSAPALSLDDYLSRRNAGKR